MIFFIIYIKINSKRIEKKPIHFHIIRMTPRQLLFAILIFALLNSVINCKTQCSCTCCKGNRCIQRYQGTIPLPTCSHSSCKYACKVRYPGQCSGSPGSLTAQCKNTKTFKPSKKKPYHWLYLYSFIRSSLLSMSELIIRLKIK